MEVQIKDVSHWDLEQEDPGGTRSKLMLINPNHLERRYMLKFSKDERHKFEFWCEVVASKYGQMLGLKVSNYEVAYREEGMGSLCYFEYSEEKHLFTEGTKLLQRYCPSITEAKITKKDKIQLLRHSFQEIKQVLKALNREQLIEEFLKMFIFDGLTGNSDRHTENWALLFQNQMMSQVEQSEKEANGKEVNNLMVVIALAIVIGVLYYMSKKPVIKDNSKNDDDSIKKASSKSSESEELRKPLRPILDFRIGLCNLYDLSSCLGHELLEEKVAATVSNNEAVAKYIRGGKQEIMWEDKKLPHFEFLKQVQAVHPRRFQRIATEIITQYSLDSITALIQRIDVNLPDLYAEYRLSPERKLLMIQLLDARMNQLKSLIL